MFKQTTQKLLKTEIEIVTRLPNSTEYGRLSSRTDFGLYCERAKSRAKKRDNESYFSSTVEYIDIYI